MRNYKKFLTGIAAAALVTGLNFTVSDAEQLTFPHFRAAQQEGYILLAEKNNPPRRDGKFDVQEKDRKHFDKKDMDNRKKDKDMRKSGRDHERMDKKDKKDGPNSGRHERGERGKDRRPD